MTGLQIALAVLLIIVSIAIIIVVLLQKDNNNASAVMGGGQEPSFFDKTKGHQKDESLAFATKILGAIFIILAIVTLAVVLFV